MVDVTEDLVPSGRLRILQVICLAMVMGVIAVLIISLVITQQRQGNNATPIISLLSATLLAVNTPLSFLLPRVLARSAVARIAGGTWKSPAGAAPQAYTDDKDKLFASLQNAVIVSMALLEGASFFGGVTYIIEKHWLGLMVILVGLGFMTLRLPTRPRMESWMAAQLANLEEARLRREPNPKIS
jgi:hypothetical protein